MAMAFLGFWEILLAIISFLFIFFIQDFDGLPWNWPIVGMLPTVVLHGRRIHDRCTEILEKSQCNFWFRGFWFFRVDMFGTADPANIHHIMSSNFANYPKGADFKSIFEILGDGIFNSDSDLWRNQRKISQMLINHVRFHQFLVKTVQNKVENGLIPVLDYVCKEETVVDLQDLFQRLAFDTTCMLVTGFDLASLSIEFPEVPFSKAMDEAEEVILFRHFFPQILWELQRLLGFGLAKKLDRAWDTIDQTIGQLISMKKQKLQVKMQTRSETQDEEEDEEEDEGVDLITPYITGEVSLGLKSGQKFLRDTILNYMIAGRDTTSSALSWFFYLVSKNPSVQKKIRDELVQTMPAEESQKWRLFTSQEVNNLVFLHASFCESLRLYPPVPFQHKAPLQPDTLPSGHQVNSTHKILFSLYALGRMTAVWGPDCMEFKPERWITEKGKIRHEPSYKFLAFNAGPRTCVGKGVAFTLMKLVAAAIIHNYEIELVEPETVIPSASIILHMKRGLKVRIANRWR